MSACHRSDETLKMQGNIYLTTLYTLGHDESHKLVLINLMENRVCIPTSLIIPLFLHSFGHD